MANQRPSGLSRTGMTDLQSCYGAGQILLPDTRQAYNQHTPAPPSHPSHLNPPPKGSAGFNTHDGPHLTYPSRRCETFDEAQSQTRYKQFSSRGLTGQRGCRTLTLSSFYHLRPVQPTLYISIARYCFCIPPSLYVHPFNLSCPLG